MASSEQQDPARTSPAADIVANAFVDQYYHLLHESPKLVHRFYQDVSKLGRPEKNGIMGITTTMEDINKKILSLGYDEFSAEIVSVDAQESFGGGVLILVTGFMIADNKMRQKFTQCFFLAPQEKGYFVLNDVFRYVDENGNQVSADDIESPVNPDNVADPSAQEVLVSGQTVVTEEDVNGEEVYHHENGHASIEEEEPPVPEVINEIPEDSSEKPKKSYASIVMKESRAPDPTATAPVRSAPKSQQQQRTAESPPPDMSEANGSSTNANENGNKQESEAEGYSIFVKGLPFNATPPLLEDVFKKYGPIKNDGIQVRTQKGFCFGFVEFEVASAVESALKASPILINGRHVVVEEKRSTNKGNSNKGRFPNGRGVGYRNEGPRGHGNYGNGRSYGRSDFNGRSEFGYRNGNRGGDGYQRNNQNGTRVGRVNRTGGSFVHTISKTTSVRVPALA